MEKWLKLFSFIISLGFAHSFECRPEHHFWRPFNGELPGDVFLAAQDALGRKSFIAKIVTPDSYSWTTVTKLSFDYIPFMWGPWFSKKMMRITDFIEVMCSSREHAHKLEWKRVNTQYDMRLILTSCCVVEGGIAMHHGKKSSKVVETVVGRVERNHSYFIGAAYLNGDWHGEKGIQFMSDYTSRYVFQNFEVLTYNCRAGFFPRTNRRLQRKEQNEIRNNKKEMRKKLLDRVMEHNADNKYSDRNAGLPETVQRMRKGNVGYDLL